MSVTSIHTSNVLRFPESTKVFTDVQLRISPNFTFQIDTLIITERYVLIVEVKNIKGTVRFVQNPPHLEQVLETGDRSSHRLSGLSS